MKHQTNSLPGQTLYVQLEELACESLKKHTSKNEACVTCTKTKCLSDMKVLIVMYLEIIRILMFNMEHIRKNERISSLPASEHG